MITTPGTVAPALAGGAMSSEYLYRGTGQGPARTLARDGTRGLLASEFDDFQPRKGGTETASITEGRSALLSRPAVNGHIGYAYREVAVHAERRKR